MTQAFVRFAPAYSPVHPRDSMIQRLDRFDDVAALVNHDPARRIGTVRDIAIAPDNLGRPWFHALADLDVVPKWLEPGSGVSFSAKLGGRRVDLGVEIVTLAILYEITLLEPGRIPADPYARVVTVGPGSSIQDLPAARARSC